MNFAENKYLPPFVSPMAGLPATPAGRFSRPGKKEIGRDFKNRSQLFMFQPVFHIILVNC